MSYAVAHAEFKSPGEVVILGSLPFADYTCKVQGPELKWHYSLRLHRSTFDLQATLAQDRVQHWSTRLRTNIDVLYNTSMVRKP